MKYGRTILIAGSRLGIGRALAAHYAEQGHEVIGLSRKESDLVHERYRHLICDVTDETRVRQVFAQIGHGPEPDVVIYSAALTRSNYAILTNYTHAENMFRTNVLGAFLITRHAVRSMMRGGFGRFIYFSSIIVPLGTAGAVMYGASKAGLEQMAFALSREFSKNNITFNCLGISIYPSTFSTEVSTQWLDSVCGSLVKREWLQLDEITAAVDFFASDEARQITGQTIYFGGLR